ncbi:MAG TPA: maleylpyruvate isomerase N-terminal domain-containing protein [Thermomicrobiales bacterium]|nr:maleylpyruvate isomerase N-terminal domain-containing protein [Thermomicrobiales bacterium]
MASADRGQVSLDEVFDHIQNSWDQLMVTMSRASEEDYATKKDAAGWTALDHMAHVTAWERTWTFFLKGRPRHEGLGVTEREFGMEYDPLNEILRARTANDSYEEVLTAARESHEALLAALRSADVERLDYDSQGGKSLDALLTDNVIDHYNEHREYIEKIFAS